MRRSESCSKAAKNGDGQVHNIGMAKLFLIFLSLFVLGCTPRVVYQKVYIPTKCTISKPERPPSSLALIDYFKELLIYVERLEKDLDFCTKEPAQRAGG